MTTNTRKSNSPALILWFVPERENAPWSRVGALWPTKNGAGFRIQLEFMPVIPGGLFALPPETRDEHQPEPGA